MRISALLVTHHSQLGTSRMLKITNTNDLLFMRECNFRSQTFVDRFTTLNYVFVIAHIDRKPRELRKYFMA